MFKKSLSLILLFTLSFGQVTVKDSIAVADSLKSIKVYENAFKTASKDKKIKDDEKAILKSLQNSLQLSKFTVNSIQTRISLNQGNVLDQSGRWPLVLQNVAWGAGLYGWGIPTVLNVDDYKWYAASELMSFTAALYLTHRYTKNMDIPHSRAQMMRLGSGVGFHYGYDTAKLFKLKLDSDDDSRAVLSLMMASVPVGIYVGDRLNAIWQPTNGQAWAISLAALIGNNISSNLHSIVSTRPREPQGYWDYENSWWGEYVIDEAKYKKYERDLEKWEQMHAIINMASYPVSLYLGNKIFGEKDYTFGDAFILYQGYGSGMLYSMMAADLIGGRNLNEDANLYKFALMAGGIGGTFMYDRMLKGNDYSFGESIILGVGTISGIAFGAAIGVIAEADFEFCEGAMIAGGIAGTVLTNRILSPEKTSMSLKNDDVKISILPDVKFLPSANSASVSCAPGMNLNIEF